MQQALVGKGQIRQRRSDYDRRKERKVDREYSQRSTNVEGLERDRSGLLFLLQQQRCDQESAEDEKDAHSHLTAEPKERRQRLRKADRNGRMRCEHKYDGNRSEAVQ